MLIWTTRDEAHGLAAHPEDHPMRNQTRPLISTLVAPLVALALAPAAEAADVVVNFTNMGTQSTALLDVADVELTALASNGSAANVFMLNLNGVGVEGGSSDSMTDGSETLQFRFDAPMADVRYTVFVANNLDQDGFVGEAFIEAYIGTTSLGVVPTHDTGFHNVSALFGGAAITGFDVQADMDGCRIDTLRYSTTWEGLGGELGGSNGDPLLIGIGTLQTGATTRVSLHNALGSTTTYLVIGLDTVDLPFYGGTLVPAFEAPLGSFLILATDAGGELILSASWPGGIPSGTELNFQHWIVDAGGPFGFAASNAVTATVS